MPGPGNVASLTDIEKERVRYHTGYPSVASMASVQYGLPTVRQTAFLLELAMDQLLPSAVGRVREILQVLDSVEQQMVDAQKQLVADQLGTLVLAGARDARGRLATDRLESEYVRWAKRLADIFGVPLYPFSNRFARSRNNIPVRQG